MRSSASSIPTDTLISVSDIPVFRLSAGVSCVWVIVAGCTTSVSTAPRLAPSVATFNDSVNHRVLDRTFQFDAEHPAEA